MTEGTKDGDDAEGKRLDERLARIRRRIVVMSGKGGVGKSTVAVSVATVLAGLGKRVGLLDADIHGPGMPTMLGLERETIGFTPEGVVPVRAYGIGVVSMGFLLPTRDEAVIWRGPRKAALLRQFLTDVAWGDLDYLVVDLPPGTGDEPLSICQLVGRVDGVLVVTTPQKVAAVDVRKAVTFCRRLDLPILGILENMAGFACPRCGEVTPVFREGGGSRIAKGTGVPLLGTLPLDPTVAESGDAGRPFVAGESRSPAAEVLRRVATDLAARFDAARPTPPVGSAP